MGPIVLLGDSIIDKRGYTRGEPVIVKFIHVAGAVSQPRIGQLVGR